MRKRDVMMPRPVGKTRMIKYGLKQERMILFQTPTAIGISIKQNFQNSKQYVDATHDFFRNPPEGTLTKTRPNGDTLYYDPKTNTFASKDANGVPRTMFRPEKGMEYWNKQ